MKDFDITEATLGTTPVAIDGAVTSGATRAFVLLDAREGLPPGLAPATLEGAAAEAVRVAAEEGALHRLVAEGRAEVIDLPAEPGARAKLLADWARKTAAKNRKALLPMLLLPLAACGGGDDGPTFTVAEAANTVTFGGTATGDITVSVAGGVASFVRQGVTAANTVSGLFAGTPKQIALSGGQTVVIDGDDIHGGALHVTGAGNVMIDARDNPGGEVKAISAMLTIALTGGTLTFDLSHDNQDVLTLLAGSTINLGGGALVVSDGTVNAVNATLTGIGSLTLNSELIVTLAQFVALGGTHHGTGTLTIDPTDTEAGNAASLNAVADGAVDKLMVSVAELETLFEDVHGDVDPAKIAKLAANATVTLTDTGTLDADVLTDIAKALGAGRTLDAGAVTGLSGTNAQFLDLFSLDAGEAAILGLGDQTFAVTDGSITMGQADALADLTSGIVTATVDLSTPTDAAAFKALVASLTDGEVNAFTFTGIPAIAVEAADLLALAAKTTVTPAGVDAAAVTGLTGTHADVMAVLGSAAITTGNTANSIDVTVTDAISVAQANALNDENAVDEIEAVIVNTSLTVAGADGLTLAQLDPSDGTVHAYDIEITDTDIDALALNQLDTKTSVEIDATDCTHLTGAADQVRIVLVDAVDTNRIEINVGRDIDVTLSDAARATDIGLINARTKADIDATDVTAVAGQLPDLLAVIDTQGINLPPDVLVTVEAAAGVIDAYALRLLDLEPTGTISVTGATSLNGTFAEIKAVLNSTGITGWPADIALTVSDPLTVAQANDLNSEPSGGDVTGPITATILDGDMATLGTLLGSGNAYTITATDAAVGAAAIDALFDVTTLAVKAASITTITGTVAEVDALYDHVVTIGQTEVTGLGNERVELSGDVTAGEVNTLNVNFAALDLTIVVTGNLSGSAAELAALGADVLGSAVNLTATGVASYDAAATLLAAGNSGTTAIAAASMTAAEAAGLSYAADETIDDLTITGTATASEATALVADVTAGHVTGTLSYSVADTAAALAAQIVTNGNDDFLDDAVNLTATGTATAAEAAAIAAATNTGTTKLAAVSDTAAALAASSNAVLDLVTGTVTATDAADATQATTLAGFTKAVVYSVSDTAAALAAAPGGLTEAVNLTATDTATAVEAVAILGATNSGTTTIAAVNATGATAGNSQLLLLAQNAADIGEVSNLTLSIASATASDPDRADVFDGLTDAQAAALLSKATGGVAIEGNDGADVIDLRGFATDGIDFTIDARAADDDDAADGNNTIFSGDGNDTITTGDGDDMISVGDGVDIVIAGDGNDTVVVGASLFARAGSNYAGGLGTDTLQVHGINNLSAITYTSFENLVMVPGSPSAVTLTAGQIAQFASIRGTAGVSEIIILPDAPSVTLAGVIAQLNDGQDDTLTFSYGETPVSVGPTDFANLAALQAALAVALTNAGIAGTVTASNVGGDLVLTATDGTTNITNALFTDDSVTTNGHVMVDLSPLAGQLQGIGKISAGAGVQLTVGLAQLPQIGEIATEDDEALVIGGIGDGQPLQEDLDLSAADLKPGQTINVNVNDKTLTLSPAQAAGATLSGTGNVVIVVTSQAEAGLLNGALLQVADTLTVTVVIDAPDEVNGVDLTSFDGVPYTATAQNPAVIDRYQIRDGSTLTVDSDQAYYNTNVAKTFTGDGTLVVNLVHNDPFDLTGVAASLDATALVAAGATVTLNGAAQLGTNVEVQVEAGNPAGGILELTAHQANGLTVTATGSGTAGTVNVTALQDTLAADLSGLASELTVNATLAITDGGGNHANLDLSADLGTVDLLTITGDGNPDQVTLTGNVGPDLRINIGANALVSLDAARLDQMTHPQAIYGAGAASINAIDQVDDLDLSKVQVAGTKIGDFDADVTFTGNLGSDFFLFVNGGATLTTSAAIANGQSLNGGGTVIITDLDEDDDANLSSVLAAGKAVVDEDVTYTGTLGALARTVEIGDGITFTTGEANITGRTVTDVDSDAGNLTVTGLVDTTDLGNVDLDGTTLAQVTSDGVNFQTGNLNGFAVEITGDYDFTIAASHASGLTLTDADNMGDVTVTALAADTNLTGVDVAGTTVAQVAGDLTFTGDLNGFAVNIMDAHTLTIDAVRVQGLTVGDENNNGIVHVTNLQAQVFADGDDAGRINADLGNIDVSDLNATLSSTGGITIDATADLGNATVTITGIGTVTVEDDATIGGASFVIDTTATLALSAASADELVVSDGGDGTVEISAFELTLDAELDHITTDTVTASVTLADGDDLSFTGHLGQAVVTITGETGNPTDNPDIFDITAGTAGDASFDVGAGTVLRGTAVQLHGKTASGAGTVEVSAVQDQLDGGEINVNLSGLQATTVTAALVMSGDVTIDALANFGKAHVTISGNGHTATVETGAIMDNASFTVVHLSTLLGAAEQLSGKNVTGTGTIEVTDLEDDADANLGTLGTKATLTFHGVTALTAGATLTFSYADLGAATFTLGADTLGSLNAALRAQFGVGHPVASFGGTDNALMLTSGKANAGFYGGTVQYTVQGGNPVGGTIENGTTVNATVDFSTLADGAGLTFTGDFGQAAVTVTENGGGSVDVLNVTNATMGTATFNLVGTTAVLRGGVAQLDGLIVTGNGTVRVETQALNGTLFEATSDLDVTGIANTLVFERDGGTDATGITLGADAALTMTAAQAVSQLDALGDDIAGEGLTVLTGLDGFGGDLTGIGSNIGLSLGTAATTTLLEAATLEVAAGRDLMVRGYDDGGAPQVLDLQGANLSISATSNVILYGGVEVAMTGAQANGLTVTGAGADGDGALVVHGPEVAGDYGGIATDWTIDVTVGNVTFTDAASLNIGDGKVLTVTGGHVADIREITAPNFTKGADSAGEVALNTTLLATAAQMHEAEISGAGTVRVSLTGGNVAATTDLSAISAGLEFVDATDPVTEITVITVGAGAVLTLTAEQAQGLTITGAGSVIVTDVDPTVGTHDFDGIAVGGEFVVEFTTGALADGSAYGGADLHAMAGETLTLTAAQASGRTIGGDGVLDVTPSSGSQTLDINGSGNRTIDPGAASDTINLFTDGGGSTVTINLNNVSTQFGDIINAVGAGPTYVVNMWVGTKVNASGSTQVLTINGSSGNDVIGTGTANDIVNLGGGADTYVFQPTAAGNGADLVQGFGTDDTLDLSGFLDDTASFVPTAFTTESDADTNVANQVVKFDGSFADAGALFTQEFDGNGNAFSITVGAKAVVVSGDVDGVGPAQVWFVDTAADGNAADLTAGDIALVATLNSGGNFDLDDLTANNVSFT